MRVIGALRYPHWMESFLQCYQSPLDQITQRRAAECISGRFCAPDAKKLSYDVERE